MRLWVFSSLQKRIFIRLALISTIPIIVIGIVASGLTNRVVRELSTRSAVQIIDRAAAELDTLFYDSFYLFKLVQDSPLIQEILKTEFDKIEQKYESDLKVNTELFLNSEYKKDIFGIYIVGENGSQYKSISYRFASENFNNSEWYKDIMSEEELFYKGTPEGSLVVDDNGKPVITFGTTIIDKANGKRLGVVLTEIKGKTIINKCGFQLGETGCILVIGNENEILVKPDNFPERNIYDFSGIPVTETPRGNDLIFQENYINSAYDKNSVIYMSKPLVVYRELSSTGWKVVGVIPSEELNKEGRNVAIIVIILIVIINTIALSISWVISKKIVEPLNNIMRGMEIVKTGDFDASIKVNSNDEIGQLENSFNNMINRIKYLVNRVYKEQKELRKAELRILQAQINPHFLYNTVDSMIWLARSGRNEDMIKMAYALINFFKVGISKGRDFISIKEEIHHVRNYLIIQEIRYMDKFIYEIKIDGDLAKYKILKLIIQPLVENSIYHGIKNKKGQGLIKIHVRDEKKCIIIDVTDSGIGMSEKEVKDLNDNLNKKSNKLKSYGIKNVNERIKIFFGKEYGLKFFSEFEKGTHVQIKIPKKLEVERSGKGTFSRG